MKTLGQIENEVRSLTSAFTVMERTRGTGEGVHGIKAAQDRQDKLFDSLTAWDAVVQEYLPALKAEYEGLKALRDGGEFERKLRAARVNTAYYNCNYGPTTKWTGAINATGLARLEYLRGILEEEAP